MYVLGIESSAHTLGVGVVANGKVLSNEKMMYPIGMSGIIPAKAAEQHIGNSGNIIKAALSSAGIKARDLDGVGYTKGPGLGPCLRVGQLMAKTVSSKLHIPIAPVNHAVAHIEITRHLAGVEDPIVLYVSGGNSQILGFDYDPHKHYRVYGETFDIGVGNMLDSFAREAKLNPAWGSSVAKLADGGKYFEMPYTVKGMDFTFTGLLTHSIKMLELKQHTAKDVAFSMQETAFAMLCEATERAMLLKKKRDVLLSGGVAQSSRLKEMMSIMADSHGCKAYTAPNDLNADNGAMIALVAEKMLESAGGAALKDCGIDQRYRADKARITW